MNMLFINVEDVNDIMGIKLNRKTDIIQKARQLFEDYKMLHVEIISLGYRVLFY